MTPTPIARSIVESVINIVFILAQGRDAAERADRHAQQKAYRDLKRNFSAGGWTVALSNDVKLSPVAQDQLAEIVAEFTTSRGHEKLNWTDESLTKRIDVAANKFPKASVLNLHLAMFNIYRHSSEVVHGTYFAAMHFWGLTTLVRPAPESRADIVQRLSEHQFSVLMSVIFALTALLECMLNYVGRPDLIVPVKSEFEPMCELPIIKDGLAGAEPQKDITLTADK